MPTPYHCHECDRPTMNPSGICDPCMDDLWEEKDANDKNRQPNDNPLTLNDLSQSDGEHKQD
tara:strand:- start:362 stop:547 length:186 start_codon:yes stop_codon:yes gene_type:complete